jgi:hypothetical protein
MTAERAARLTVLGFVWEPVRKGPYNPSSATANANWEAQLARLAAYKTAHGDCSVPHGWTEDPRLASWVKNQRKLKRRLDRGEPSQGMTAERAARLAALGFAWEGPKGSAHPNVAAWEAQLARLAAYKAAHSDCSVPRRWAEDPGLASWVDTQRAHKKKLDRGEPSKVMTVQQAARLTELGFVWDQHEAERGTQLARLTAYKAAHGDCNVPRHWAEDPRLASWVDHQRRFKRQLEPSEASPRVRAEWAQLTALGFVWDIIQTGGTPVSCNFIALHTIFWRRKDTEITARAARLF